MSWTAVVLSLGLSLGTGSRVGAEPLSAVADLRYGAALYHYYQQEHLQALSELMVAEQRGGIQGHGDNPEIMVGGFAMAYGLERYATDIFTRLLDQNRSRQTQDVAWFHLASMAYERGDLAAAAEGLQRISEPPQPTLAAERNALAHSLALLQGDWVSADHWLRQATPEWAPYMHYNQGAAYSREGRYSEGLAHFRRVQAHRGDSAEALDLHDKARTAAGYALLFDAQYAKAIEQFTQVRLNTPGAHRALLGYGWAAVAQQDYALALRPWQALSQRSLVDEHTQEVRVALPYAYEQMGHEGLALDAFRQAESQYLNELERLRDAKAHMAGYALREALDVDPDLDINWLERAGDMAPHTSYLVRLFAQARFLNRVQTLRDLLAIQKQFRDWQDKLDFYQAMLDERERNLVREMDSAAQHRLDQKIAALVAQRDRLAETLADLRRDRNFLALSDAETEARALRITRAEANIQRLQQGAWDAGVQVMPAEELEQLAESLRRQKGLLLWQAAEGYDARLWRADHELSALDAQLHRLQGARQSLQRILDQGFELQPHRQRLAQARERLLAQGADVDRTIALAQDALRHQVIDVLAQQQQRLEAYLAQSRLAIARLLDRAAAPASLTFDDASEGGAL